MSELSRKIAAGNRSPSMIAEAGLEIEALERALQSEREACAAICDAIASERKETSRKLKAPQSYFRGEGAEICAAAIRAR